MDSTRTLGADDGDLATDTDMFKEFVVSQEDLMAETAQEQLLMPKQQVSKELGSPQLPDLETAAVNDHLECQASSHCSDSNSLNTGPPLSPSIDGSDEDASPTSSVTFAGIV